MTQEATREEFITPRVNIIDQAETVVIEAELPGVTKEGTDIEIKEGALTLTGLRANGCATAGTPHIAERPKANFRRSFTLSESIETENVQAEIRDGLLKVTLHKAAHMKPKLIKVK